MEDKTYVALDSGFQARSLAKLTWEDEGAKIERIISGQGLTIGRSAENDLVIGDLEASRFHSKILPESGNLIVVDLDSTNGTFLNEDKVKGNRELHDGDRIKIGQLEFLVTIFSSESAEEVSEKEELPFEKTLLVLQESNLPRLVVSVGMGKGTEFSLNKDRLSIGRASSSKKWDIDLIDKAVSRPHAELAKIENTWVLTDLNSANGTTVNGARLTDPHELQDGDVVTFGETTLIVHLSPGE